MISLTKHDFQWGRSEFVIIYPDDMAMNIGKQMGCDEVPRKNKKTYKNMLCLPGYRWW